MKFQNNRIIGKYFLGKTTKMALFILLSVYSSISLNINAQKTITICSGSSVNLVPTNAGTVVEWKDQAGNILKRTDNMGIVINDLSPKVTPTSTTTYTVKQILDLNLIPYGSFDPKPSDQINAAMSSFQYWPGKLNGVDPNYGQGYFTINTNPQLLWDSTRYVPRTYDWGANWYCSISDHTTGHGNMFIANGSSSGDVFKASVNVTAGTTYYIGAWFANINVTLVNPYKMSIYVGSTLVGQISGANNSNWYQKYGYWTATTTGKVDFKFQNSQTADSGNDFAIDDIVFSPVVQETVTVNVNNSAISATTTANICSNSNYVFNGKTYNTTGVYTDTLVSVFGCDSLDILNLNVNSPSVAPIINQTICEGDSVEFHGTTYKTIGTYYAHLTSSAGCDSLVTLVLNVDPALKATISGESTICKDSIVPNIVFKGERGTPPYTFTYQINDETSKLATTTSEDTVSIAVPTSIPGTFTYKLISIADSKGCSSTLNATLALRVEDCNTSINIPNAFSPNGDGFNDTFGPITVGITEIKLSINDRNGRLVFTIDSINGRWDGLMPTSEQAPVGVYFYKYDAKGVDNKSYSNQGSVSLFREMLDSTPLAVTPSQVKGNATVDLSKMKGVKNISIYNTSGRKISTKDTSEDMFVFDSSQLTNGLYILKVSCNNQVVFAKFIKE